MTQTSLHRLDIDAVIDENGSVEVAEAVNVHEPHTCPFAETLEVSVRLTHSHRRAVCFREKSVALYPLRTQLHLVAVLPSLKFFQLFHNFGRQLDETHTALSFRGVRIYAFLFVVFGRSDNAEKIMLPVNVFPFKSEQFTTAKSCERCQSEENRVLLVGFTFVLKQFKHLLNLVQ